MWTRLLPEFSGKWFVTSKNSILNKDFLFRDSRSRTGAFLAQGSELKKMQEKRLFLHSIGLRLYGSGIGAIIANYIYAAWRAGEEAVVDCEYVQFIGGEVLDGVWAYRLQKGLPERKGKLRVTNAGNRVIRQFFSDAYGIVSGSLERQDS